MVWTSSVTDFHRAEFGGARTVHNAGGKKFDVFFVILPVTLLND